ncbi:helix-turn-helix transcriptional regulator [Aurantibacter sp.]|uniref:response regulator transcription factor n=1 Tax=Aurantibacter sp. TaxID=2807103 RepID=UPI0032633FE9
MKLKLFIFFLTFTTVISAQYNFSGQIDENNHGKTVYLSVIEDYRKLSRISFDQIIKKTTIDSLGYFSFVGDNLSLTNRIYRIHLDECDALTQNSNHFFGKCENSKSVLFIANNNDTVSFPTSFADQILCEINSTNKKSSAFLEIDIMKEEMAFDFNEFHSVANKRLNSKKWFSNFQSFSLTLNEPLAELYIFDFLSDKRNETYSYYIKDVVDNSYYSQLSKRLQEKYPDEIFTQLYESEIASDKLLHSQNTPQNTSWKWLLGILLGLSIFLNIYLIWQRKTSSQKAKNNALGKLTSQEQKIVDEILNDKTNKEIAADLFISLSTVKTHINNLYKKLNVSSREEIKQLLS